MAAVLAPAHVLRAQPPAPGADLALDAAYAERGATLEVSVLTFANGEVLWERFGHNALVLTDQRSGESVAYNWGMFDFDQPNFLTRFLTGDTRYWMAAVPTDALILSYIEQERSVRRQLLDLTDVEKGALAAYLTWNGTGENAFYRYDYYNDNCSTRVRDAIDRATGGRLRSALSDLPSAPTTWRRETARVTDGDWPPFAGIHLALGRNADRLITRWDESFLPGRLADHLLTVERTAADGTTRPLVVGDTVLYRSSRAPLPAEPPFRGFVALVIGGLAGGLVFLLGLLRERGTAAAGVLLRIAATSWYLVGGVLGTALLLAGTVTKHAPYMGTNVSLLQVHPLLLVAAVCAPFAGGAGTMARLFRGVAVLTALLAVLGLVLQLTVWWQDSLLVTSITVPLHLAFAASLALTGRKRPVNTPPAAVTAQAA